MDTLQLELAILNRYCVSTQFTARLLTTFAGSSGDLALRLELARRANDALRQTELWAETIRALGGRPRSDTEPIQARHCEHAGMPHTRAEALALVQVTERRLARQLARHFHRDDVHPIVRATLRRMIEEELQPGWTTPWLARLSEADADAVEEARCRYAAADRAIGDPFIESLTLQSAA
jgi:hypothetical protein